jgi:hypothetical protein
MKPKYTLIGYGHGDGWATTNLKDTNGSIVFSSGSYFIADWKFARYL